MNIFYYWETSSRSLRTESSKSRAFKEVKSLQALSAVLGLHTTTQAPLGRAPNTWPSHNIQWEFRFMREGERLWHRPCPMTSLRGSCSPLCVDSVTAHVDPWKIGCAFLPIVLTPINCGLPTNRPFPLGYLTLKWISQALGPLSVCLHETTGAAGLGSLTLHWLLKLWKKKRPATAGIVWLNEKASGVPKA